MKSKNRITVEIDGACEPVNPGGTASYGFVVKDKNRTIKRGKGIIGEGEGMTNNVAEYTAAIEALRWVKQNLNPLKILLIGDSQLLIRQLKGEYAVRSSRLRPLYEELKKVLKNIRAEVDLKWVPREENTEADRLSKEAIEKFSG